MLIGVGQNGQTEERASTPALHHDLQLGGWLDPEFGLQLRERCFGSGGFLERVGKLAGGERGRSVGPSLLCGSEAVGDAFGKSASLGQHLHFGLDC